MDVIAVPGRLVRDPATRRVIGSEPVSIDPTQPHWVRLLADGDVTEAPATKPDHQQPALAALASKDQPA